MKMTLQNPEEIKIFILYLLDRIGYPLSYTDIGTIVIRDGIIDYFAFCEYFDELLNAGHIAEADDNGEPIPPAKEETESEANAVSDEYYDEDEDENQLKIDGIDSPYLRPDRVSEENENEKEQGSDGIMTENVGGDYDGNFSEAAVGNLYVDADSRDDKRAIRNAGDFSKKYVVTKTGRLIADSLSENILMAAVREKSYMSAMRHLSLEKRGAVVDQTFERDGKNFIFHCSIKDKDGMAMKLSLRADTIYQLNRMRINFDEKPDVVLRGVIALLTGNVNYLFEN